MNNLSEATELTETAMNSSGLAAERYGIYLESAEAKINSIKSSLQGLGTSIISSDTANFVLDITQKVLNLIETVGGLDTVLGIVAAGFIAFRTGVATATVESIVYLISQVPILSGVMSALSNQTLITAASLKSFATAAIGIGGAVIAAISMYNAYTEKQRQEHEALIQSYRDLISENDNVISKVNDLKKEYADLFAVQDRTKEQNERLASIQEEITSILGLEEDSINLLTGAYEENTAAINENIAKMLERNLLLQRNVTKDAKDKLDEEYENNNINGRRVFDSSMFITRGWVKEAEGVAKSVNEAIGKSVVSIDMATNSLSLTGIESMEEYIDVLEEIMRTSQQPEFEKFMDSKNYESIAQEYKNMTDQLSRYNEELKKEFDIRAQADLGNMTQKLGIKDTSAMSEEEYRKLHTEMVRSFTPEDYDEGYVDYLKDVVEGLNPIEKAADKATESVEGLNEATKEKTSFNENLGKAVEGLEGLQKVYDGFKDSLEDNDGEFTPIDLKTLEELRENFGELGPAFEDFENTMMDSSTTAEQAQQAFDDLAQAYLVGSTVLDGLNTSNRELIISQLELQGIQNAGTIVTQELAMASEALAQEGMTLSQITAGEALEFIKTSNCADQAKVALVDYTITKMNANGTALTTDGDIANLIALINYLGGAISALQAFQRAKAALGRVNSSNTADIQTLNDEKSYVRNRDKFYKESGINNSGSLEEDAWKEVQNQLNNITSNINSGNYGGGAPVSYGGGSASNGGGGGGKGGGGKGGKGGSGGSKKSEKDEWLEKELDALEKKREKIERQIELTEEELRNAEQLGDSAIISSYREALDKLYQDKKVMSDDEAKALEDIKKRCKTEEETAKVEEEIHKNRTSALKDENERIENIVALIDLRHEKELEILENAKDELEDGISLEANPEKHIENQKKMYDTLVQEINVYKTKLAELQSVPLYDGSDEIKEARDKIKELSKELLELELENIEIEFDASNIKIENIDSLKNLIESSIEVAEYLEDSSSIMRLENQYVDLTKSQLVMNKELLKQLKEKQNEYQKGNKTVMNNL